MRWSTLGLPSNQQPSKFSCPRPSPSLLGLVDRISRVFGYSLSISPETEVQELRRLLEEERAAHQKTSQELQEKDAALAKFQRREITMVNHVNRKSFLNLPKTLVSSNTHLYRIFFSDQAARFSRLIGATKRMVAATDQGGPDRVPRMRDAFNQLKAVYQDIMAEDE